MRRTPSQPAVESFGVNVIGYVTGNLGLGVATRNTITMLLKRGVPTMLTDVDPGGGRIGHDLTFYKMCQHQEGPTPFPLTIFHLNPPVIADGLWMKKSWSKDGRVNAAVPFWELPTLPEAWVPTLAAMDIILAPTRFVQEAVKAALPDSVCFYYRQAVYVPPTLSDRRRWGIPENTIVFVSSFDVSSDIERKNPEAAVEAFREAFPDRDDVRLVLKVNASDEARKDTGGRLQRLLSLNNVDRRIILIDQILDYADTLSLYASSDVLISLHRSEGLGLSLMEAMSLGKPVIGTGWSGNMDFMTPENSCLVGYDIVPVNSNHPCYCQLAVGESAIWVEPHVWEAAEHMRRMADNPELIAELGARAAADMESLRQAFEDGEIIELLRKAIAPGGPIWSRHAEKSAMIRRIARGTPKRNIRRLGGRVLRRLGLRK